MTALLKSLARMHVAFSGPFFSSPGYKLPRPGDAQSDAAHLMADMHRVGADLRQVAERQHTRSYEQANKR